MKKLLKLGLYYRSCASFGVWVICFFVYCSCLILYDDLFNDNVDRSAMIDWLPREKDFANINFNHF